MVLITYRPEYRGALTQVRRADDSLAPLDDSATAALLSELSARIPRSATRRPMVPPGVGNPFFAEEIVRDLIERGRATR